MSILVTPPTVGATVETGEITDGSITDAKLGATSTIAKGAQSASVRTVSAATAGAATPLVIVRCPTLTSGTTKMILLASVALRANTGCTSITPSIDQVSSVGAFIGNIAYWVLDQPIVGERFVFTAPWPYDPRLTATPPDVDLGTGGSSLYLGLSITPIGGTAAAICSDLTVLSGGFPSITVDDSSANLLADVN